MEREPPSRGTASHADTSNLGMSAQDKLTFGRGLGQHCVPENYLQR